MPFGTRTSKSEQIISLHLRHLYIAVRAGVRHTAIWIVIEQDLKNLNVVGLFDAIICDYVLVHLEKAEKIIQLFLNALKTNGYLLIEFLSTDDPSCKRDENIRDNTLVSHGIFHKFYSTNEVEVLLSAFNILELRKIQHYDPDHVEDYPRSKNHKHDSIYVLCQKT